MKIFIFNGVSEDSGCKSLYRFRSKDRIVSWPMQDGAFLGMVGCWNFLFRLGMQPEYLVSEDDITPAKGDLLFAISENSQLAAGVRSTINRWLADGGIVLASGYLPAWKWLLPPDAVVEQERCEHPYAALAWKFGENMPELVAPPRWSYGRLLAGGNLATCGNMVSIIGERQVPQRATIAPLRNAPAVIHNNGFVFLNGNPFSAFQAWLQGQEDLVPWLQWRHRMFWLDEQVAFLLKVINEHAQLPRNLLPRPIQGLPKNIAVLRHDLDNSKDISYLETELEAGLPGVHTMLRDNNTNFWLKTLRKAPGHEAAFHYTTAKYNRWLETGRAKLGLSKRSYRPARRAIVGNGLLKQVRWAKKKGIGIATLHRHLPFLIYPEWIDALHYVFEKETDTLGGSSLFRGQVLRWGCDRADGVQGTYGDLSDVQFPYWFPYKLAHAGLGGAPLRGWETSSVMEIEPELFSKMLDHNIPGLLQRIITINYHPAHASRPTFYNNGSLPGWKKILQILRERNIEVRTLRNIYTTIDNAVIGKNING